jgi:predicted negative regulator of RcsB-dependent stress response
MNTDEEQVEKLKAWLKENGLSIVLGIVVGVGGLSGYRYWTSLQETAAEEASRVYAQMMDALAANDRGDVEQHARQLIDEHAKSEYAQMARLAMARSLVDNGEYDAAKPYLESVVGSSAQGPLGYIARMRLAALHLQTEQLDAALSTLAIDFPGEFTARVAELRGDIYVRQGNANEAIDAYRTAQEASPGPANPAYLQQKLTDLGARG